MPLLAKQFSGDSIGTVGHAHFRRSRRVQQSNQRREHFGVGRRAEFRGAVERDVWFDEHHVAFADEMFDAADRANGHLQHGFIIVAAGYAEHLGARRRSYLEVLQSEYRFLRLAAFAVRDRAMRAKDMPFRHPIRPRRRSA